MIAYDVLDSSSTGKKKRILQLICKFHSLRAHYQDTWCKLFKTAGYKKAERTKKKVRRQIDRYLVQAYPGITYWDVECLGSRKLTDVQQCKKQRFLLAITRGKQ